MPCPALVIECRKDRRKRLLSRSGISASDLFCLFHAQLQQGHRHLRARLKRRPRLCQYSSSNTFAEGIRSMGQHEYEYLTEASIELLDQMTGIDHRSMFNCLYEFEGSVDTGFTLLSVQDILIKRRYVYAIRLEEHPDYERFKAQLEAIRTKGFERILRNPSSEWELQSNPAIAYWNGAHLCCEAGSEFWERLVREGRLTGA